MKSLSHFKQTHMNENSTNGYIDIIQWLHSEGYNNKISSEDTVKKYYVQEETDSTIKLIVYAETSKDRPVLRSNLQGFLQSSSIPFNHSKIGGSMGRTEIDKQYTNNNKKLWINYKYASKGISVQELLVGALVLVGETHNGNINLHDADIILSNAASKINHIKGVSDTTEYIKQLSKNYLDLAPSLSSSNSILQLIKQDGQSVVEVYWTGHTWDKEIQFLNPPIGSVKNYNSSDIILKTNGNNGIVFYGFSLKKKAKGNDADPTLINKTITGNRSFLLDIIPNKDIEKIENSKYEFFRMVVEKEFNIPYKEVSKMKFDEIKKQISTLENDVVASYLRTNDNIFFKTIDQILPSYAKTFTKEFLDEVFKTKLSTNLETKDFKFNLNTGIGSVNKDIIVIESAENKDLVTTVTVLTDIFQTELSIRKTQGTKQAWEVDAKATKLFYTIYSDETPIVNIEIRYKGSFTAEPQFQAVARPDFKNLFHK